MASRDSGSWEKTRAMSYIVLFSVPHCISKRPALTPLTGLIRALESTLTTAVTWKMPVPFDVDLHLWALTQQLPRLSVRAFMQG